MNTQLGNKEPSPRDARPQRQGCWGLRRDRWGQGSRRGSEQEQEGHRRLSTQPRPVRRQVLLLLCLPCDSGGDDTVRGADSRTEVRM